MLGFELPGLKQEKDLRWTFGCLHLQGNAHLDTRPQKSCSLLLRKDIQRNPPTTEAWLDSDH